MKRISLILLAAVLASCSTTQRLVITRPHQLNKFNQEMSDKSTRITLRNGNQFDALYLNVNHDSTSWTDLQDSTFQWCPTADVATVSYTDHTVGAHSGAFIGAMLGLALGYKQGFSQGDDPPIFGQGISARTKGIWSAIFYGAPIGAFFGSMTEAAIGRKPTYQFFLKEYAHYPKQDK